MKPLFFLLCLLNLGFLLWQFHAGKIGPVAAPRAEYVAGVLTVAEYDRAQRGARISAVIQDGIRRRRQAEFERIWADPRGQQWHLPAVKAVKPRPLNKIAEKPPQLVPQAVARKCFDVGPFTDEAGVKKWLAQKALTGKQILQREQAIDGDFQVYYPSAKTAEQTLANKMMLKDKGLQDIWLIPEGDRKGAISLGVFRDMSRAMVFKAQLAARGVQSEIRQRDKTETRWFAKVMLDRAGLKQYESQGIRLSACANN